MTEGLQFMWVGMTTVFAFLGLLVIVMQLMARWLGPMDAKAEQFLPLRADDDATLGGPDGALEAMAVAVAVAARRNKEV